MDLWFNYRGFWMFPDSRNKGFKCETWGTDFANQKVARCLFYCKYDYIVKTSH